MSKAQGWEINTLELGRSPSASPHSVGSFCLSSGGQNRELQHRGRSEESTENVTKLHEIFLFFSKGDGDVLVGERCKNLFPTRDLDLDHLIN